MTRILALVGLLVACQADDPKRFPKPDKTPDPVQDDSPRALCQRGCSKVTGCTGAGPAELTACVDACAAGSPRKENIEQLEAQSCEQIKTGKLPIRGGGSAQPPPQTP